MIALLKMVEQQMARDIIGPFILLVWKTSKEEILEGAKPNVKLEGKFLARLIKPNFWVFYHCLRELGQNIRFIMN